MPDHDRQQGASDRNAAVFAGFLGWTLDAFDYFLVVYCLTAIAKEYHRTDAEMALAIPLTLAFRPVGAFLFGLLADRYGRRLPLMIDLVFYSLVEVITAFAPSYTWFLILRALFGIGMGGEWGVGASLAMEKGRRVCEGCFPGCCRKATRLATCWPLSAITSSSIAGDGGPCSSSAACPRCWRYSFACA